MEDDKAGIAWNGKLTGERGSVRLIGGWERLYAPEKTAGLRLNKASVIERSGRKREQEIDGRARFASGRKAKSRLSGNRTR